MEQIFDSVWYYLRKDEFWVGLFIGALGILFVPHFRRMMSRVCSECGHIVVHRPRRVCKIKKGDCQGQFAVFIFVPCHRCGHTSVVSYNRPLSPLRLWCMSVWEPEVFRLDAEAKGLFRRCNLSVPPQCEQYAPLARQPVFVGRLARLCHALGW